MKPAPFEYLRARSVDEAIDALDEGGYAAKALAGGQSLIPAMNFRLAHPELLVDLGSLDELRGIEETATGGLIIGAMTSQREVERSDIVAHRAPLLHEVMPWIAHAQIRTQGTIGGSLVHADPAAELPSVMQALDAVLHVRGREGDRSVAVDDFYLGIFTTALEPGELLVSVEIPAAAAGARSAFEEVSRRHGDFALAGVAVQLEPPTEGSLSEAVGGAAISLLSVGDGPVRARAGAEALVGGPLTPGTIDAAASATAAELDPPADIHASAEYRRHLAEVLTRRALLRILRSGEEPGG